MMLPGLLTIITPVIIGLVFGAEPLGGYMAGVCVSGVMWAIFQNNAGGAWDNAKKSIEAGVERSEEHTSELQSRPHLVCRLLLGKKKKTKHRERHNNTRKISNTQSR